MKSKSIKLTLAGILAVALQTASVYSQALEAHLTAITVFSLGPGAIYDGVNGWDTVPTNGVPNIWVGTGTAHYNGPSDAEAGIDLVFSPGGSSGGMPLAGSAGSLKEPYHGINLFFNGSTVPQISAYQPTACGAGTPSAYSGTSLGLAGTVPAANSLRCVVNGLEIELGGYLWSQPSCAELDTVSPFAWSPDGANDFSGVYLLVVSVVPKLAISLTTTNTAVVGWPSPSTGWMLQQNTNSVGSVNWSNITATIQDDGTTKTLIVNPPTGNRFYRLKQSP